MWYYPRIKKVHYRESMPAFSPDMVVTDSDGVAWVYVRGHSGRPVGWATKRMALGTVKNHGFCTKMMKLIDTNYTTTGFWVIGSDIPRYGYPNAGRSFDINCREY